MHFITTKNSMTGEKTGRGRTAGGQLGSTVDSLVIFNLIKKSPEASQNVGRFFRDFPLSGYLDVI